VFELNEGQHHDHLVCLTCGRVEEFFDPEIEQRQRAVAQARGFDLQDHALALYALHQGRLPAPQQVTLTSRGGQFMISRCSSRAGGAR
jgi:hypothetical protein